MNKQRYVSTSFWDDCWIRGLNPLEKYLYLYLMTNPLTNIAGVYKITIDRICFDTGLKEAAVREILEVFQKKKKACMFAGEYMILPAWPEHQQWRIRSKIKTGIELILKTLPDSLKKYMVLIRYRYPIEGYPYDSNYSDSDLDSDLDSDSENTLSGDSPSPDPAVANFIQQKTREDRRVPVKTIIDYFNERCMTNFSSDADYAKRLLKARWNEGYRLEDFKAVIDVKSAQWATDPKMVRYLRPATLFAPSKFDGYLNEARKLIKKKQAVCPSCGMKNGLHAESCSRLHEIRIDQVSENTQPSPAGKLAAIE